LQPLNHFYMIGSVKSLEAIKALSALASEARLAVYRLLVKRGPEGYTPSELIKHLDVPAPTLSFHLKELLQAGLIVSRRESRNLYYSPSFERMNALVRFLTENCCSLANEACGTDCQPVAASSP
jgi:ArsR family transcriptional regulator, arsenate/arsenite/antimonite-responsive transcriptional repressor